MKKPDKLQDMTVEQMVERFVAIALDQDKALLRREHARFNRLFDKMEAVEDELRSRDGDQRRALLSLYNHPSTQVRVKAVKATLAVTPEAALRELKEIAESRKYPQAGEAGMSLLNLERGIFKPS